MGIPWKQVDRQDYWRVSSQPLYDRLGASIAGWAASLSGPFKRIDRYKRPHVGLSPLGIIVANIKSQKKRILTNAKRQDRNKAVRSELKTRVKTAVRVATQDPGSDDSTEALRLAIKRIDKAATKGVIHKNQAANRKSKLMHRIAALSAD